MTGRCVVGGYGVSIFSKEGFPMVRGTVAVLVGLTLLCTPFVANGVQAGSATNLSAVADEAAATVYGAQSTCSNGLWRTYPFCKFGQADNCTGQSPPCGALFCPYSCQRTRPDVGYPGDPDKNYYRQTSNCSVMLTYLTCTPYTTWWGGTRCNCTAPGIAATVCTTQTDTEIIDCT